MRETSNFTNLNITPLKRFSQNFLRDPGILRKIVRHAHIEEGDVVLEIGPGLGSLTNELIQTKARVFAVEKDQRLIAHLKNLLPDLILFEEDFLEFSLDRLPQDKKIKVVANLPYNITSPILAKLIPNVSLFSTLTLMVQEEVARRIVAPSRTTEIGSLTYFLRYYSNPSYLFSVSRKVFHPVPKVDSAVIQLSLKEPPFCKDPDHLFSLIHRGFQQRRKMLRGSLRSLYPSNIIEDALRFLSLSPESRPEMLSLEEFIQLSHYFLEFNRS